MVFRKLQKISPLILEKYSYLPCHYLLKCMPLVDILC
uniref:Bm14496 n=1 Tax=Brugia malayi TaxID=6279 RepID=A0A1I9G6H6_BRUMA|nr:Bm14496 [Brugia malayi]